MTGFVRIVTKYLLSNKFVAPDPFSERYPSVFYVLPPARLIVGTQDSMTQIGEIFKAAVTPKQGSLLLFLGVFFKIEITIVSIYHMRS